MSQLRLGRIGDFTAWVREALEDIRRIFDHHLWPASNFSQFITRGTTPGVANTEFVITHNLNRPKPSQDISGNWVSGVEFTYWLQGAGTIYESDFNNWTENAIKLKCTDASRGYTIIIR